MDEKKYLCAHNLTTPTIFQDEGNKYSRAYWTLASKCTKYGDDFYLQDRPRKHRYIYVTGNKFLYREIRYKEEPYPKRAVDTISVD